MKTTRIALASIASDFGRTTVNLERMLDMIDQAALQQAQLVCFPELSLQGYHRDAQRMRREAEAIDGPSCSKLLEAARRHGLVVSVGMALNVGPKVHNAQVFLTPDGPRGFAAKVHLGPVETALFDEGDQWPVIDLEFVKVGTVICYDAEFPEAGRCLALDGAELILMSFATGRCDSCGRPQDPLAWSRQVLTWAPARAYENRVFVAGVNHAGDVVDDQRLAGGHWIEPGATHRWPGYSFVVGPDGAVLAESDRDHNRPRLLVADLDPKQLEHWRVDAGDFLSERRPHTYRRLMETAT